MARSAEVVNAPAGRGYHREMRDLRSLPKVELHLHVEGSARPATLREFADRDGANLPHGMGSDGWTFGGSLDFIDNYLELCQLFATLDDFRRLAVELCADLAATGVPYAEAVFSPGNHARRLDGDWFGPIEAVLDGLAAGERDHGVRVQLCPDIVRDNGLEDAQRTLEVAVRYAGRGVVALNCAGSERTGVERFAVRACTATVTPLPRYASATAFHGGTAMVSPGASFMRREPKGISLSPRSMVAPERTVSAFRRSSPFAGS